MNGTIAAIITLGFGAFGSVNLTTTIGYGIDAGAGVSTGTPIECFTPIARGQTWKVEKRGDVFSAPTRGQVFAAEDR